VEWSSMLFFLFLFALAGVMKSSGISDIVAKAVLLQFGHNPSMLSGVVLYSSGLLSSILDNTVVVAAYIPVISSLGAMQFDLKPLWWAVLFGACFGGNITVIGSTANIVAIDILEKKRGTKIGFLNWLKIGLTVGVISMTCAYLLIILVTRFF
jgi:Na+/H+ antiporter NhaD/arsenite permease-like protein